MVHGTTWMFFLRIVTKGLGLAKRVILARLLAPNDFGLFGIALVSLSALKQFSTTGFSKALIQKQEDPQDYLNPAWTIQVIRGLLVGTLLIVSAPFVAEFFGETRAGLILRVIGAGFAIKSFRNIGIVFFSKDLEFHKRFLYKFLTQVTSFSVAVIFGFITRSVWALVFGLMSANIVTVVSSYFLHPFRPSWNFNLEKSKELFTFGKWLLGISVMAFIATQGDDIFLGRILGASALGLYQMAYRLTNITHTGIAQVLSQVTFPSFSKLQNNMEKLRKTLKKVLELTYLISIPFVVGTILVSYDFVRLFLGQDWLKMVPAMQILAVEGLFRAMGKSYGQVFKATGNPRINFWITVAWIIGMWGAIYPLTSAFGLVGTSVATLLGAAATIPFWVVPSERLLDISTLYHIKPAVYPILASAVMGAYIILVLRFIQPMGFGLFFFLVITASLVYFSIISLFWKMWNVGPVETVLDVIKRGGQ